MKSFTKTTLHPDTGDWQIAEWRNDWFGMYEPGVIFPNGDVFDPRKTVMRTRDDKAIDTDQGEIVDASKINTYKDGN